MRRACLIVSALLAAAPSGGAEPTPLPSPTPAPTLAPLSPELEKLQFLAGEWVHQELHHRGVVGSPGRVSARSKAQWVHNNRHLHLLYRNSAAEPYEGRGFFAWDGAARLYHLDWFDSRGVHLAFSGRFGPDGVLVLSADYQIEGQPIRHTLKVKKQTDGGILVLDERATSGPPALHVESLAKAAPPEPTPTPCDSAVADPTARPRPTS
jgi:hypothetical protein